MTLPHSRLKRLESSRRGRGLDDILSRCDEGTATLNEMAMVLGDQPERFLSEYLIPLAKDVIEKVETGAWCYGPCASWPSRPKSCSRTGSGSILGI